MSRARAGLALCLAAGALMSTSLVRAEVYYVNVAGLGGEADYEQRFTGLAADLDRITKGGGASAHVVTLSARRPRAIICSRR